MDDVSIFPFSICAIFFNFINFIAPVLTQGIWGLHYRAAIYLERKCEKAKAEITQSEEG